MDTAQITQEETAARETEPQASANLLVLPSLEIKNFRAFRHLTIEKLGRVNLITGKNNVGKTSLLEALQLLSEKGHPPIVRGLLRKRDELFSTKGANKYNPVSMFERLFYQQSNHISIRDFSGVNEVYFSINWFDSSSIKNDIEDEWRSAPPGRYNAVPCLVVTTRTVVDEIGQPYSEDYKFPLNKILDISNKFSKFRNELPYQLIGSQGLTNEQQAELWDNIAMTAYEDTVEDALRLLSPTLRRLAFIQDTNSSLIRIPMVRIAQADFAVPLRSLGEGVNKMLSHVLSAANAANGLLLIDEIENGLHYSVLPDVWRLIFQTARRLNVQVFATTHSWDCIEAFQQAASEDDDPTSGVLVRLQNENGNVTSTVFDERRLAIVTRDGIEVR